MGKDKLQWHPAFAAALRITLSEEKLQWHPAFAAALRIMRKIDIPKITLQ